MKVLLTGFEPFGGEKVNPSWLAVTNVQVDGVEIVKKQVPVEYGKCNDCVRFAQEGKFDVVICVGQAGGRSGISVEKVALNVKDANAPDNVGVVAHGEEVVANAPLALQSTLPTEKIAENIAKHGITAHVSYSAGTYVCNCLLYSMLWAFQSSNVSVGFIHVPFLPEQTEGKALPSMELPSITKALEIAIDTVVKESALC